MDVLVVGAGEMGTWFGDHFDEVAYADRDETTAERAAAATDGRVVPVDTAERFDVVCLAVPIPVVAAAIADHAERATGAVVDVTGVMEPAVAAMREHAADRERLSLHPLFSARNAPGRVAAVTDEGGPLTDRVTRRLADRGNELFDTTTEEHDRSMATVQASAHAAVIAFGLAAEPVDERFHTDISAELFDLVERVTDGTPRVYSDIQGAFDGAEGVAAAARAIADADEEAFERRYAEARRRVTGDTGEQS